MQLLARPTHSIDLVSAYFVPGKQFTETLMRLAENGLRVRILTNSLMATNHAIVHSAYVKYRPDLLRAGVELYELKPGYAAEDEDFVLDLAGSSRATLHSKTLAVDEQRIFIGSFNFDPRSFLLNTEMGVVIDSPRMASAMAGAFVNDFPQMSYVPELIGEDALVWKEPQLDGPEIRHEAEPGMDRLSRLLLWFFGLLPIEWLL